MNESRLIGTPLRWIATFNVAVSVFAIFVAAVNSASTLTWYGRVFALCGWFCLAGMAWLQRPAVRQVTHGSSR